MESIRLMLHTKFENALQKKKDYELALSLIPKGVLIKKIIKGHTYYYLIYRDKGKVKFEYKGANVSQDEITQHEEAKALRAQHAKLLTAVNAQIKYLTKLLRHKE